MSTKTFGIYTSGEDGTTNDDELTIEIGYIHIACMVTKQSNTSIAAFELFSCTKHETSHFQHLFSTILGTSRVLNNSYSSSVLYINHEFAIPVPAYKFNKEIASDYLEVVFGEDLISKTQFDHLDIDKLV